MKVIIAGGRAYKFTPSDLHFLDGFHKAVTIEEVVSGGAGGADREGERWAINRGIPIKLFMADWENEGKAAGPIRNQKMVDYADVLIAFPGGRGTSDIINRAQIKPTMQVWQVEQIESLNHEKPRGK